MENMFCAMSACYKNDIIANVQRAVTTVWSQHILCRMIGKHPSGLLPTGSAKGLDMTKLLLLRAPSLHFLGRHATCYELA